MSNSDYLEITFRSINCFADDGKLDVEELNALVGIAMQDGTIDEDEKRVLRNIINRLSDVDLTEEMHNKIHELRSQHDI